MRIRPFVFGIFVLVVFMGTIWGFQLAGVWSVSGKTTAGGEAVQPSVDDVNTIKGWMTLEQITSTYNVSLEALIQQFKLPADTAPETAVKDLESEDFSVSGLRAWLQEQRLLDSTPATLPTPTPIAPATAIPTLAINETPAATSNPTEHVAQEKRVTGQTTFQDLLDWGVPVEVIETIIGGALPAPTTVIKDYITSQGLSFGTVKSALQVEVDKNK